MFDTFSPEAMKALANGSPKLYGKVAPGIYAWMAMGPYIVALDYWISRWQFPAMTMAAFLTPLSNGGPGSHKPKG